MTEGFNPTWRLVHTGLGFVVFGICAMLFSLIVFPFAWLWPHRASRQGAIATVIHWFFRALVAELQWVGVMELDVRGRESLRARRPGRPSIVIANHPTWLDVVVLLSLIPSACCVVKKAHWRNPFLYGIIRAAKYVSNADPAGLVDDGARQLAAGYTMIVFPEGTRSPAPNRLHAFSRGFAHMALKGGAQIVPVLLNCDPPAFTRQMRWYDVPARPFRIQVTVLEPVGVEQLAAHDLAPALAARFVTNAIEAHITRNLFDHGFFKT